MCAAKVDARYIENARRVLETISHPITVNQLGRRLNYNHHWTLCVLAKLLEQASDAEREHIHSLIVLRI